MNRKSFSLVTRDTQRRKLNWSFNHTPLSSHARLGVYGFFICPQNSWNGTRSFWGPHPRRPKRLTFADVSQFSLVALAKVERSTSQTEIRCSPSDRWLFGFCERSGSKVAALVAFLITFYNLVLNENCNTTVTHSQGEKKAIYFKFFFDWVAVINMAVPPPPGSRKHLLETVLWHERLHC